MAIPVFQRHAGAVMLQADGRVNFDLIVFTIATGFNAETAMNTVRIPTYEAFAQHLQGRGKVLVVTDCVTTFPEFLAFFGHPGRLCKRIRNRRLDRKSENLFTYTPLLPLPLSILERLPTVLREVIRRVLSWDLRRVLCQIGMDNSHRVVSVNDPRLHFVPGLVDKSLLVYDCLDDYSLYGWETNPAKVLGRERNLIEKADIIFTTSRILYEKMHTQHGHVYYFPNAVDFEFFNQTTLDSIPVAPQLEGIPRPIIGFMGHFTAWYDFALLGSVIQARPDWSFVFIGWTDSRPEIEFLKQMPNVYFLGTQEFQGLPSFLKGFDVAIMPYKLNASGRSVNPDKMYQYFAAGVPLVATPTPEIAQYSELIGLADNPIDFVRFLEQRLAYGREDWRVKRGISIAQENTWKRRVQEELAVIQSHLVNKG